MKRLKLFFACLLMAVLSIGQVWGETVSFGPSDFSGQGTPNTGSSMSATKSGVTVSMNKGYGTSEIRAYSGSSFTISSSNTITALSFTFSNSKTGGLNTSYTELSTNEWSQASLSSQARFSDITVTYTPATPSYTINAESNNTTYGTVSLTGSVITATRNPGYRYASPAYTVTSGTATVAQSGDAFTVTPSTDCTVRINFEPIPTHNIIFNNGGVKVIANAVVAEGASYDITEAVEDALIASCTYKHFEGWTLSSSIADASVKPALVTSIDMAGADVNLYAVYSVTSGGGSNVSEETASVAISDYADEHSWGSSSSSGQKEIVINSDITASLSSGSNTGKYYNDGWRTYQTENATLTISAADGCELTSATFTYTVSNTGALKDGTTSLTSGTAYEISGSSKSFSVGNSGSATNGQVRFTAISVNYNKTTSGTTTYSLDAVCAAPGQCVAPTYNHGTGTYNVAQSIELSTTTEEADIYYTLDGTTPSKTNGSKYTAAFSVSENTTVKAIAVKDGNDDSDVAEAVFTFVPLTPTITKDVRHFMSTANVTIECETAGVAIHYTVDGSEPLASSPTYSTPFEITANTTIKAIAVKANWNNSEIASETFTKATILNVAGAHSAITAGGDLTGKYVQGTISQIDSYNSDYHSITYWISDDGTTTNQLEVYGGLSGILPQFTGTSDLSVGDMVIVYGTLKNFNSTHEFDKNNEIVSFTRFVAMPTFNPEGAGFLTTLNVSLATTEDGAQIRYTIDGSDPTSTSTLYSDPIELSSTTTIKAATFKGEDVSAIITKTYTKATKINVTDALAALDSESPIENQCVYGVVSTSPTYISSGKLTYSISVNGEASNQLKVYNGKGLNGANFANKTDIQVGDLVTVFGTLKIYNEEKEFDAGNYLLEFKRLVDPELEWSTTSFDAFIGQSNTFPTLSKPDGVMIVYSSSNPTAATIDENTGAISLGTTPNVSTTITATLSGDATYKDDVATYTLNVYNPTNPGTITYEENGGSEVADEETPVDNFPDPLPEPTKENNIFAGWWTTSTFDENTQAVAGAPMSGNIILYAKWIQIPPYALVYTSNVEFEGTGSAESNSKVTINSVEYDAQKVGTSKGATGTVVVTVPAKTNTLHFHIFTWKNQSNTISISGDLTNLSASTINVDGDDAGGGSSSYTIESNPVDHYQFITFDPVAAPTEITFAHSAGTETRFIMYGINQEGGVLPVLDHIVITGDATELEYEVGDEFNPAGLGVNAIYTLEEVEQTPVAVDAADIEWSFDPANIAANTESVTVTATVGGKSANKTVENIVVNIPTPEILVNPASVAFGTVNQDATVDAEVINVTLKSVENATIALTGDIDAFTLDKTALTENGTISVTPVTSVAGTFAATITISDDASAAESKEVALSMTVKAPEVPDVCDGTDDFDTDDSSNGGDYKDRSTTDGWTAVNTCRKTIDEHIYWTINGKTTNVGIITSPVLNDGIGSLKFRYANTFSESNGVSVKIEIKQNGSVVKEYTLTKANSEVTQNEVYTELIEDINVAGDFQIVFTNLCPSNKNNSNKDRVSIGRLCWTGYTAPVEPEWTNVRPGETLTVNKYYTVCLSKNVTDFRGGNFWNMSTRNGSSIAYLEEVTTDDLPLAKGTPYIFEVTGAQMEVVYEGAETNAAGTNGALVGTFASMNQAALNTAANTAGSDIYLLSNNSLVRVTGANTYNNSLAAGRAYIVYDQLTEVSEAPHAPGKRVRAVPMQGQTATGVDALNASETPIKMIIDGQLYILRGEKMYDATGKLVK